MDGWHHFNKLQSIGFRVSKLPSGRICFCKGADIAGLYSLAPSDWRSIPVRIAHVVNTFRTEADSPHDRAQRMTLESMRVARDVAPLIDNSLKVRHLAAVVSDQDVVSDAFDDIIALERTIQDLARFQVPRPLPLIQDILDGPSLVDDEVLIYTNVDIAIVPNFYAFVADLFRLGLDALIVNRRTVSDTYPGPEALSLAVAEVGAEHSGYDCFAFRAGIRQQFVPWQSCVGIAGVMSPLLYNILAVARAPCVLLDAHVTFHLGDDKAWQRPEFDDYAALNREELVRTFQRLCEDPERKARMLSALADHPGGRGGVPRELRSWRTAPKPKILRRVECMLRRER